MRKPWTPAEEQTLRALYPDHPTPVVAQQIGRAVKAIHLKARALGLRKSAAFYNSAAASRIRRGRQSPAMQATQFKPGHQPWNKGIKGSTGLHPNCRATQFRAGEMAGAAKAKYQPIGTLRINREGALERKMTDDPSIYPARRWIPVARLVWEAAHGPIPPGHCVVFANPRERTAVLEQITPDKLICITKRENMRRNSAWSRDPELARLYQLKGAITRQVNRIQREHSTSS